MGEVSAAFARASAQSRSRSSAPTSGNRVRTGSSTRSSDAATKRSAPNTSAGRSYKGRFPFVFKPDNPDQTHDFRSDHDRLSTQGIKTVLHPVSDLATAKEVYAALLGVPPQTDESYYVGFGAAGQHIGLPDGGPQGMTSPVAYWHVPDLEAKLAEVTAAGATVKEPAHDVGGGRLVATVTDPDGIDRFAARTGFDPRALATPYRWFRISPRRIQAWREVNELPDRELMRDGRWLV